LLQNRCIDEESWYPGTADAVFQNLTFIRAKTRSYIVVLAGDHIYKMTTAACWNSLQKRRNVSP